MGGKEHFATGANIGIPEELKQFDELKKIDRECPSIRAMRLIESDIVKDAKRGQALQRNGRKNSQKWKEEVRASGFST